MPSDNRDVIVISDGREFIGYHDAVIMPNGCFADENYNPCQCDGCHHPDDTDLILADGWREIKQEVSFVSGQVNAQRVTPISIGVTDKADVHATITFSDHKIHGLVTISQ